jgi:DNA-nicking Smr family endonuclease
MTLALLIALVAINIAYIWARDRDARRLHEATAGHVRTLHEMNAAHMTERAALLQRIQAPDVAVVQYQQDMATPDESYPLSDEETARIQEQQLALERLERMEREGVLS